MPRVRLARADGSFYESAELSEVDAENLHARYFQLLNGPRTPTTSLTGVGYVEGDTHGLPGAVNLADVKGVGLYP